ncbi:unnamed protein product [Durusdinium trenchii]|uniref:Sulfhydryl oxidase n=1 Tax=Durusdinium trenchii TaxID=1381693 RepID=A0ABP0RYL4_9DINO
MARSLRLLLVLLFGRFCEGFYCRVLEDVARNLPRGWRQALRQFNALLCPAEPKRPELSEEYLQHLEHPALFFRVDFTKKDLHEKVGLDLSLRKDYLEVDKVIPDGPAARWSAQKPLKALQRRDRIIEVNRVIGNATKMVEELKRSAFLRLLVLRVSEEDRKELERQKAEKDLLKVLQMPGPPQLLGGIPEPSNSKVATLHARNVEQFLAIQPITVLMVYAHGCSHSQRMTPEFRRAAELLEVKEPTVRFAKFNHGDKANGESDLCEPERLNVSSYPAFFLINGGQHEPFSVHSAEEMAAFVSAKVRGKDPDREIRKVLLKIRPMLYREDTPPEEVLDLEPEAFDETVLLNYPENNRIWIIKFYSEKCPFCRSLKPEYRRASREVKSPNIRFAAVNSRAFPDLAERFGVSSYPWVISIYAGRRGEDMTGLGGAESLVRFAREQHQKLYSGSPSWAEEWPRWPAQDSLSSLAEPSNSSGGTWRELLGRSTWFLLHSMAARYPETPSKADQVALQGLFASLGQHFPCPICRTHLREKLLSLPLAHHNRTELTKWLCQLHNMVNKDLHKAQHSCNSFELDLQYLKSCGECTQVHIEEEDEVAAPGHWNYFQYMEMAPAEARRHEL